MLVLSRDRDQSIVLIVPPSDKPQEIKITLCDIHGGTARLGTTASKDVKIFRNELLEEIRRKGAPETVQKSR